MANDNTRSSPVPLIPITDSYHPTQDRDDPFGRATILALLKLDLRGGVLDTREKFLKGAPEG